MKPIIKCDVCRDRDTDKTKMPCAQCTCNKLFRSHFHEDKIVSLLRNAWDIHDDVLVDNAGTEEEAV